MVKIGIDARLYSQTGVGVYLRNLLHFLENEKQDKYIFHIYLLPDDYKKVSFKNNNFVKREVKSTWHSMSEQTLFLSNLYKDNLDLMHFTYFGYPVMYKKKFIATIHDTTPLLFKTGKASTKSPLLYELKFQAFKFVISQQIKNAKYVITPTRTVKNQLVSLYGEKYSEKIKPIYEGVNYELTYSEKKIKILELINNLKLKNKNFLIYIGNFYPHKNVENLVKAYSEVKTEAKLILIGPKDFFSSRLLRLINHLKQNKRIIFYHNPTKEDLVHFYKSALALIHPSLSEGFGLPLIEAANYNLPVIASDIEVFRELLNESYIKFDPKDPEDIAVKVISFLKGKYKSDYKDTMKKFSFEEMTKKTFELYRQGLL